MKSFLLFMGSRFYADGGWHDFKGVFQSTYAAMAEVRQTFKPEHQWWHVVDAETKEIVAGSEMQACADELDPELVVALSAKENPGG
jgi:hypothetical protein